MAKMHTPNGHHKVKTSFRRLFARLLRTKSVEKFTNTLNGLVETATSVPQLKRLHDWLQKHAQSFFVQIKSVLAKWDSECLAEEVVIEVRFSHKPIELCKELLKASQNWNIGGSADMAMRRLFFRNRIVLPREIAFAA